MSENKKFDIKFENNTVVAAFDGNQDGEASVALKVFLKEVYEEIALKGEAKVNAVISFKMVGTKLLVNADTDKDGEAVASLELDLLEGFEEIKK